MKETIAGSVRTALLLALVTAACLAIVLVGGGSTSARAASGTYQYASSSPDATCPAGGQCFADVESSNGFYANINNLYMDDIIGGYACGGPGEPCDSENRPYYRPGNNVTRQQMAKFADLSRRNIATATGISLNLTGNTLGVALVVSNTVDDAIDGRTSSNQEAIQGSCTRAGVPCYALYGSAQTDNYSGYFLGGKGLRIGSPQANYAALDANTTAAGSYAVDAYSANYRSVRANNNNTSWYGLYVDTAGSTVGAYVNGNGYIQGNLTVTGSCCLAGNVVQNADTATLQPGDVVTIVGSSPAVLGEHPVITVKKASSAYDTGVVGIIDAPLYVPDAQTRATYLAEQQAQKDAQLQREQAQAQADAAGTKFDASGIDMPEATISDAQGTVHTDVASRAMTANTYASIVTSGSYQSVKVDASYGAIKAGDLLVSSPNPGYAMKATDMAQANGAVIGKALGNLDSGTGTVPVMVILK
jgi:hypothetical protein